MSQVPSEARRRRWPLIAALVIGIAGVGAAATYALRSEPPDLKDDFAQAAKLYESKELAHARLILLNVLQADPQLKEARRMLGEIYLAQKNGAAAEKELSRANELGIPAAELVVPLARARLLQGKHQAVLESGPPPWDSLDTGIRAELQALHGHAQFGASKFAEAKALYEKSLATQPENLEGLVGQTFLSAREGDAAGARVWLERAIKAYPNNGRAWTLLGDIEGQSGFPEAAATAYGRAITLGEEGGVYLRRAQIRIQQGQLDGATEDLDVLLTRRNFVHPMLPLVRAELLMARGDNTAALALVRDALQDHPKFPPAQLLAGILSLRNGHLAQARAYLNSYNVSSPGDAQAALLLARIHFREGNVEKAEDIIAAARAYHPSHEGLLELSAWVALKQGRIEEAISGVNDLALNNPESPGAALNLGMVLSASGNGIDALGAYQRAETLDPDSLNAATLVFNQLVTNREYEKALEKARGIARAWPAEPHALTLLGYAHILNGNKDAGRQALMSALKAKPGDPLASRALAQLALREGDPAGAQKVLQDVLEQDPDHLLTLISLATVEHRLGNTAESIRLLEHAVARYPGAGSVRLQLAARYREANRLRPALEIVEAVAKTRPDDPQVLSHLALLEVELGHTSNAISHAQRLVSILPQLAGGHYLLAKAYALAGDDENMRRALIKTIELNPKHLGALLASANLMLRTGRTKELATIVRVLQEIHPDHLDVVVVSGQFALATRRYDDAVKQFERAMLAKPSSTIATSLAQAYQGAGRIDRGVAVLQSWTKEHPEDVEALTALAAAYVDTGEEELARKTFESALQIAPRSVHLLNNIAWLLRTSAPRKGLEYAAVARRHSNDEPMVLDTYAVLLLETGESREALELLSRASEMAPDEPSIRFHLARALAAEGQRSSAINVVKQALGSTAHFPERETASAFAKSLTDE